MLCSDFRAVRKNDPLLPDAACRETITSTRGISDAPPASGTLMECGALIMLASFRSLVLSSPSSS
jgi:hypothetical protein